MKTSYNIAFVNMHAVLAACEVQNPDFKQLESRARDILNYCHNQGVVKVAANTDEVIKEMLDYLKRKCS